MCRRAKSFAAAEQALSGSGDAPEFVQEPLHSLPDGVRGNRDGVGDFVAGVSIQFDLDQEVELSVAEKAASSAALKKMP